MKRNKMRFIWLLAGLMLVANSVLSIQSPKNRIPGSTGDEQTKNNISSVNPPSGLQISVFNVDITPPIGYKMAFNPVINQWEMGLKAKGLIITGQGKPIVICAFDWHSIANGGQKEFRQAIASAAGTVPERVAVHTLHQHDAPICDFSAEKMLKENGLDPDIFNGDFAREVIDRMVIAIKKSVNDPKPVTYIGMGKAEVYKVASNRRILGSDGKVRASRSSSSRDPELRAEPEGVIDPEVSLLSFWNGDEPLAVISYYATHPQSYYRTGIPNPDFPGVARFLRQLQVPDALHIHFNGAAGNVAAGKYNDGSHENRYILAERLADGMKRAWEATEKVPVTIDQVSWNIEPVSLPPAKELAQLEKDVKADKTLLSKDRNSLKLSWYNRLKAGEKIDIQCLTLGKARVLFMPGELFVEYQLAAKKMRPDLFVCMAAYGDFGPHYIGTAEAYEQGGYEIKSSDVSPEVEGVLMGAIEKLLKK